LNTSTRQSDQPDAKGPLRGPHLTVAELEQALRTVDRRVFLAPPRILRRVIRQDCQLPGMGLRIPHRKSYTILREPLLKIVEKPEIGLDVEEPLPEKVLLLTRPDQSRLDGEKAGQTLLRYWRLLFHLRVHLALDQRRQAGQLDPVAVAQRVARIGQVEFEEVRAVLEQEGFLLPPRDDPAVYVEFAAVALELKHFAPGLLACYFPAIEDWPAIDEILAEDVDDAALLSATRLPGTPDPMEGVASGEWRVASSSPRSAGAAAGQGNLDAPAAESDAKAGLFNCADLATRHSPFATPGHPSEMAYRRLLRRAERAAAAGNVVRSAICRVKAQRLAPPELRAKIGAAVKKDIDRLICRLQVALEIGEADRQAWHDCLETLVETGTGKGDRHLLSEAPEGPFRQKVPDPFSRPSGIWTAEARLLYDLQKVCVDHEREIYTVDLVEWAGSWGQRPIHRGLPSQREVLMSKHLRSATRRLAVVRLSDGQREQLSGLLRDAGARAEQRLRQRLRPRITTALDDVALVPVNRPEKVARQKLIEELLDRVVERGFLTMGDLRDALSRNNLKLPDSANPRAFLRGDQLLQADHRLSRTLDGVYRRGEFYLRWMQQLSSLAFGTTTGRFLTRYAAVPFGGALLVLRFADHVVEKTAHTHLHLGAPRNVAALGLLLLGLIYVDGFRRGLWWAIKGSFVAATNVVKHAAHWVVDSPVVQRVLKSRAYGLAIRFVVKPLVFTVLVNPVLPLESRNRATSALAAVSVFLGMNVLLNSRLGRNLEELLTDGIVVSWQRFGLRILKNLFWLVVDLFKFLVQSLERLLYTVDEWLRFRSGETRLSFGCKAILGALWFFVAYVIRFCVNLLIEPQVNPIKHFPVVTVSHKLLWPFVGTLTHWLVVPMQVTMEKRLAYTVAGTVAGITIFVIPGIFGFLVWELRENWRLYAANRPQELEAVPIGHHGETMACLLRPGFHSGTLPKLFARLRRAERRARVHGDWSPVRKHLQSLVGVEHSIRQFVDRELVALLGESQRWKRVLPRVSQVRLASNRVAVELSSSEWLAGGLGLVFELRSGLLVADRIGEDWSLVLGPEEQEPWGMALLGLLKSAGAEDVSWRLRESLVLLQDRPDAKPEKRTVPFSSDHASPRAENRDSPLPDAHLLGQIDQLSQGRPLGEVHIPWRQWVEVWTDPPASRRLREKQVVS
jgi:hypothetical protein